MKNKKIFYGLLIFIMGMIGPICSTSIGISVANSLGFFPTPLPTLTSTVTFTLSPTSTATLTPVPTLTLTNTSTPMPTNTLTTTPSPTLISTITPIIYNNTKGLNVKEEYAQGIYQLLLFDEWIREDQGDFIILSGIISDSFADIQFKSYDGYVYKSQMGIYLTLPPTEKDTLRAATYIALMPSVFAENWTTEDSSKWFNDHFDNENSFIDLGDRTVKMTIIKNDSAANIQIIIESK